MMKEYKQLICGLGWKNDKAVALKDGQDMPVLAAEYCRELSHQGADQIFLADCAENDGEHEASIGALKEIAREVDVPIITGGRVARLEDVKKYLYAGASAVYLDVSSEEQVDLMKEVSSRFGSEAIYAWLPGKQYLKRAEEYLQLGASKLIVNVSPESKITPEEIRKAFLFLEEDSEAAAGLEGDSHECSEKAAGHAASAVLIALQAGAMDPDMGQEKLVEEMRDYLMLPFVGGVVLKDGPGTICMKLKQVLKAEGISVDTFESTVSWEEFKRNSDGLIPVIVQDYKTSEVLMMAYMNQEAFQKTLETGTMTYYSRSRQKLWLKGETSGHFQYVKSLSLDCDNDTILAKVHQVGAACHTGNRSCFFQTLAAKAYKETNPLKVFEEEYAVIQDRKANPKEGSYTNYLFEKGIDKILKKCGEEATEIIIAAKNPDPEEIKYEIADFLYHIMVLMVEKGITWEEITKEIANR